MIKFKAKGKAKNLGKLYNMLLRMAQEIAGGCTGSTGPESSKYLHFSITDKKALKRARQGAN